MPVVYTSNIDNLPPRPDKDLYTTEHNLIWETLDFYSFPNGVTDRSLRILDIGANDGRWGITAKRVLAKKFKTTSILTGVEIRPLSKPPLFDWWYKTDFMDWNLDFKLKFDLIVSNPPYQDKERQQKTKKAEGRHRVPSMAEQVIFHAANMLAPFGRMIFMLPLDFITTEDRYKYLWPKLPLAWHSPIAKRPAFNGHTSGGTGNFAIYVWDKGLFEFEGTPHEYKSKIINYER